METAFYNFRLTQVQHVPRPYVLVFLYCLQLYPEHIPVGYHKSLFRKQYEIHLSDLVPQELLYQNQLLFPFHPVHTLSTDLIYLYFQKSKHKMFSLKNYYVHHSHTKCPMLLMLQHHLSDILPLFTNSLHLTHS